jgi:tRNA wybutosine-synthesizing protein 3
MALLTSSELVPDEIDDASSFLPSFADLRRKNLEALYGEGDDKSPKGSVDVAIRDLCDLVNTHPSYVTLSSCSGRIAIFDPKDSPENAEEDERTAGGKGKGEWILVSHEPVDPASIPPLLDKESKGKLIFKHEPLLLHIAASSLARGRKFLSLALQLGFRESGLVVSPTRVTVAIRSHSLSLCVPLAYSGALRPSDDYLVALVEEANQQMKNNMDKLNRLENEIRTLLFQLDKHDARSNQQVQAKFHKLPALNLWGHDAVTVPSKDGGATVYVFGGYGSGPSRHGDAGLHHKVARSNRIYSLRQRASGDIARDWKQVEQMGLLPAQNEEKTTTWFGVDVSPTTFAPTEGLQACLLQLDHVVANEHPGSPVIAIWGGRSGPCAPFGDLLLYEPETSADYLSKPVEVRGDLPSPRWGHTLTPLSGKDGMVAILIGGKDEEASSQENVHVLSLIEEGTKRVFTWTRISTSIPPQFHHSVTALDGDSIVLVGGLSDPNDLLECFSDSYRFVGTLGSYSRRTPVVKPAPISAFRVTLDALKEITLPRVEGFVPHYGAGSCCLTHNGRVVLPFIGGMPLRSGRKSLDMLNQGDALDPMRWHTFDGAVSNYEVHYEPGDVEHVNFAAMVHNCCVSLPNKSSELLILGGGVSSFAFGPSFAE